MKSIAFLFILLGIAGVGVASYIYTQLSYIDWPYVIIGLLFMATGLWGEKIGRQRKW